MKQITYLLFSVFIFVATGFAQKKWDVTFDLHYGKTVIFGEGTLFYTKKTSKYGVSLSFGNFSRGTYRGDRPYVLPLSFFENEGYYYRVVEYTPNSLALGIGGKVETKWEVGRKRNACFLGAFLNRYFVNDKLVMLLEFPSWAVKPENLPQTIEKKLNIQHSSWAIGLYFGYRHNISRKISVFTQINMPYYFPIRTELYDANQIMYPMVGLETNISVGINYKLN